MQAGSTLDQHLNNTLRLMWPDRRFATNNLAKLKADSTATLVDSKPSLQIAEQCFAKDGNSFFETYRDAGAVVR
jgi:hypothetical protein